ncbi:manganese efflux pump [Planctomycetes bacterium TBK1r]|uniref:manganese efflux pump n=1 Tax=Stieleria magnilauensis TaxID=2527963 RepID=UPI0011A64875
MHRRTFSISLRRRQLDLVVLGAAISSSVDCIAVGAGLAAQRISSVEILAMTGIASGVAGIAGLVLGGKIKCLTRGRAQSVGGICLVVFAAWA